MSFSIDVTLATPGAPSGSIDALSYSYSEQSSPLSGGDSSGSVGTFGVSIKVPDEYMPAPARHAVWLMHDTIGDSVFHGAEVVINDSRKGFTSGRVTAVERSQDGGTIQLSGVTRLALLNANNVQAQPYSGTLNGAVAYYMSIAGITSGFTVDASIATTPVVVPGWYGELWYHIKQLTAAYGCDISLVSNVILVRPVRERVAAMNRDVTRTATLGGNGLAQAVEVYQYNNRPITNELVYPVSGPTIEDRIFNVNAGEDSEYTLQLSASLSSFQVPTMLTSMAPDYTATSAYVITTNDDTALTSAEWTAAGGRVTFELDESTSSITVKMRGASGLMNTQGEEYTNFSMSLSSPVTGNRFSTLRIVGSGVAFNKQVKRIRTGVPATMTSTDVGVTIDNPCVSTADDVARVGLRAAREYSGMAMRLSGSVISINRRGDTGQSTIPTYEQVESALATIIGGTPTYAQVQSYHASLGLTTYKQVQDYWEAQFADEDADQVFGNVQGARVFDKKTRRWYRIRSADLGPGLINFSDAEDDLTYADYEAHFAGKTYGQVQAILSGFNYRMVEMAGLYG